MKGGFSIFSEKYRNIEVKKDVLQSVLRNIQFNSLVEDYYEVYAQEQDSLNASEEEYIFPADLLRRKRDRIIDCNSLWLLDVFDNARVKNFKKTNLCRDKFCHNCKKVKQASRMARYIPEMEVYKNYMYHMILTVPNVKGSDLKKEIRKMAVSFRKLIKILRGDYDRDGFGWLSSLGYLGAVRSLEVTFDNQEYHPHYHVAVILQNVDLEFFEKKFFNVYSYSYGELKSAFSILEITIQKLWYLLHNSIRITKENFDNLDLGYSCKIDKFQELQYQELFKYLVKGSGEKEDMTFDNFKCLYESLYRIKQIQGYGCLYRIQDDDEEMFNMAYNEFIKELYEEEEPRETLESPGALVEDTDFILISQKTYISYLRQIGDL